MADSSVIITSTWLPMLASIISRTVADLGGWPGRNLPDLFRAPQNCAAILSITQLTETRRVPKARFPEPGFLGLTLNFPSFSHPPGAAPLTPKGAGFDVDFLLRPFPQPFRILIK